MNVHKTHNQLVSVTTLLVHKFGYSQKIHHPQIAIVKHGQPLGKTALVFGTTYSAWLSKVHTHFSVGKLGLAEFCASPTASLTADRYRR